MASLISPGVNVSVIDESFYTPAEPGMTPMVFVVSRQDKTNAAGTGTASGTTKANAGVPQLITSYYSVLQRTTTHYTVLLRTTGLLMGQTY